MGRKKTTLRQKLWKEAKSIGYPTRDFRNSTNQDFKDFIEKQPKPKRQPKRKIVFISAKAKQPKTQEERLESFVKSKKRMEYSLADYDIEDLRELLPKLPYNRKKYIYILSSKDGKTQRALNDNYLLKIKNDLGAEMYEYGSDPEVLLANIANFMIVKILKTDKKSYNHIGMFPYKPTDYLIKRANENIEFQILLDAINRYIPKETEGLDCLGNCIKIAEYEDKIPKGSFDKYISIHTQKVYELKQSDCKKIAELLGIYIVIHKKYDSCNPILNYGNIDNPTLELNLYENHCFLHETTIFNKWAVENGYNKEHAIKILNIMTKKAAKGSKKEQHIYNTQLKKNTYTLASREKEKLSSINFVKYVTANKELMRDMTQVEKLKQINYKFKVDHTSDIISGFVEPFGEDDRKDAKSPFFPKRDPDGNIIPNSDLYDDRIFADFETFLLDVPEVRKYKGEEIETIVKKHIADMLVTKHKGVQRHYLLKRNGTTPAQQFFQDIGNNVYGEIKNHIVIFHNLGYDINFITSVKGITISQRMKSSSAKIKCLSAYYYGRTIHFKDSYTVIPEPLSAFEEKFKCKGIKKGECPYELYNKDNIHEKWAKIEEARKYIKKDDTLLGFSQSTHMQDFEESIKPYINPNNPEEFDHMAHRLDYCIQDVEILEHGYTVFRKWMAELTEQELDFCVSLPQAAFNTIFNKRSLSGVCPVSGVTLLYLQNFIVGGRCMSNNFKKWIINDVADFDATSLYPSAMCRTDFVIPEGPARELRNDELATFDPKGYLDYMISIRITKVCKKRDFPLIHSRKRGFTNRVDKTEIIYVCKIMLEDLLEFQPIEYEVIGGMVWDKGCPVNDYLKVVMKELFNERNRMKNIEKVNNEIKKENALRSVEGLPLLEETLTAQNLVKLIMNAAYGRMIMRAFPEGEIFFNQYKPGEYNHKKYRDYVQSHYNSIKDITELDNLVIIKKYKSTTEHQNYAHVGINILAMSKRIMNEVMCLAEDNEIMIYYQDTDSMHMKQADIEPLCKLFKDKYGRELKGKQLGQFESDFESPKGYHNTVSETFITVGKKSYIDHLRHESIEKPGQFIYTYHMRMKGIPHKAIHEKCKENTMRHEITPLQLYAELYKGEKREMDMLAGGGCSFEFRNFNDVYSLPKFTRYVQFPGRFGTKLMGKKIDKIVETIEYKVPPRKIS